MFCTVVKGRCCSCARRAGADAVRGVAQHQQRRNPPGSAQGEGALAVKRDQKEKPVRSLFVPLRQGHSRCRNRSRFLSGRRRGTEGTTSHAQGSSASSRVRTSWGRCSSGQGSQPRRARRAGRCLRCGPSATWRRGRRRSSRGAFVRLFDGEGGTPEHTARNGHSTAALVCAARIREIRGTGVGLRLWRRKRAHPRCGDCCKCLLCMHCRLTERSSLKAPAAPSVPSLHSRVFAGTGSNSGSPFRKIGGRSSPTCGNGREEC